MKSLAGVMLIEVRQGDGRSALANRSPLVCLHQASMINYPGGMCDHGVVNVCG